METVPVEIFPPTSEVGLSVSEVSTGGFIVKVADWELPFRLPEIAATV
jgi:hypothetical protein